MITCSLLPISLQCTAQYLWQGHRRRGGWGGLGHPSFCEQPVHVPEAPFPGYSTDLLFLYTNDCVMDMQVYSSLLKNLNTGCYPTTTVVSSHYNEMILRKNDCKTL